jgi:hypothetical protein
MSDERMRQVAPFPHDLAAAVEELRYLEPPWRIELADAERGQGCSGLTLSVFPDKPDSYHPERHVNTLFTFPVPAAAFNRESWEEWLWGRIEDVENHERAENFKFVTSCPHGDDTCPCQDGALCHYEGDDPMPCPRTALVGCTTCVREYRRPFKPAHPDGWDPSVVRSVVSETVTNTPNAGRLVSFPCECGHDHGGRMGEHFRIETAFACTEEGCPCPLGRS